MTSLCMIQHLQQPAGGVGDHTDQSVFFSTCSLLFDITLHSCLTSPYMTQSFRILTVILFIYISVNSRPAYPSVFDRISTEISPQYGCTGVFLKIRTEGFQKVWKLWREQMQVRCQRSRLLSIGGVIVH